VSDLGRCETCYRPMTMEGIKHGWCMACWDAIWHGGTRGDTEGNKQERPSKSGERLDRGAVVRSLK